MLVRLSCVLLLLACLGADEVAAQQRIELDRIGAAFELPEGWEAREPFVHPQAEVRCFSPPGPDLDPYLCFELNETDREVEVERWVRGLDLRRIAGSDTIERVGHDLLDRIGERGTTVRVRQGSAVGHVRFFEHRGRRMILMVGGSDGMTEAQRAMLRPLLESVELTRTPL